MGLYFSETLEYSSPYMPSYELCFLENAINLTFYYITTLTYCYKRTLLNCVLINKLLLFNCTFIVSFVLQYTIIDV